MGGGGGNVSSGHVRTVKVKTCKRTVFAIHRFTLYLFHHTDLNSDLCVCKQLRYK